MLPGVGLPIPANLPPNWRSQWCPQLKPPGGEFTPPPEAAAAGWDWRLNCPARGWVGGFGEVWQQRTTEALRLAWEIDLWGTKAQYDGNYTVREYEYAVVYVAKNATMFYEWWKRQEGGSEARPFVFDDSNAAANKIIIDAAKTEQAWPPFGEVDSFFGWSGAPNGWKTYVKNMVRDESETPVEPPTPPPLPIPPPAEEPPVPPTPTVPPTQPPPTSLSPVAQRVSELTQLMTKVVNSAGPPWVKVMWKVARESGLVESGLTSAVRVKRKVLGEPEEGRS